MLQGFPCRSRKIPWVGSNHRSSLAGTTAGRDSRDCVLVYHLLRLSRAQEEQDEAIMTHKSAGKPNTVDQENVAVCFLVSIKVLRKWSCVEYISAIAHTRVESCRDSGLSRLLGVP